MGPVLAHGYLHLTVASFLTSFVLESLNHCLFVWVGIIHRQVGDIFILLYGRPGMKVALHICL